MNEFQVKELQSVCNLEVRKFPFARFHPRVHDKMGYTFKPIIIAVILTPLLISYRTLPEPRFSKFSFLSQEVFREFEAFWILDSSVRFHNKEKMEEFYKNVRTALIGRMKELSRCLEAWWNPLRSGSSRLTPSTLRRIQVRTRHLHG